MKKKKRKNGRLGNLSIRPTVKQLECQAKQFMTMSCMIDDFVQFSGIFYSELLKECYQVLSAFLIAFLGRTQINMSILLGRYHLIRK